MWGVWTSFFDDKMTMTDVYTMFFRTSMNVPRIMGYLLAYLYQSVIIYGKKITKQDIENASEKYYEDNIDAFFRSSTYCLLSIEEKRNIAQLKKVRDAIVDQAKEIKRQIDRKVVPKKQLHIVVIFMCYKILKSIWNR